MDKNFLEKIFNSSDKNKIFIIGDVMLDRYLMGDVNRISPEAPVQVFDIISSDFRLGGAANVSYNIRTLGADPFLIGVIGDDNEGVLLRNAMNDLLINTDGLIIENGRPTTSKTRVISDSHHLLRIDSESKDDISDDTVKNIISLLEKHKDETGIIILQDYNKGVLTIDLIKKVIDFAINNNIRVLVDPKFEHFFEFKNTYLFKPNRKELEDALGKKIKSQEDVENFALELMQKLNSENIILTLGEEGMMIFENHNGELKKEKIPTKARKVADVSGAGDTVISTIAVCLAGGASLKDAAIISNYAAGLVVEEVGIVPVYRDKLIDHITKERI
ncbi:MAG TPA: D-glycero-beta-D-manno-heptose-7-phosphate kinase [Ignavibacteria bacterium]|nr:D-glycero-beta-D-manno-heptose-7-phosphate kinase [Ignavibacteria bacterium]HMR40144.1 D-glycero-beta-D-manno-heptose-7-phosphate kinase [Ignavibacteria bacterium]